MGWAGARSRLFGATTKLFSSIPVPTPIEIARGERANLIFAGDAAKNQAELTIGKVDMTLDLAASRASIRRLRMLAAQDPANVIVCGHDRLLSLDKHKVVHLAGLQAAVTARLSQEFEEETIVDLVRDEHSIYVSKRAADDSVSVDA